MKSRNILGQLRGFNEVTEFYCMIDRPWKVLEDIVPSLYQLEILYETCVSCHP